MGNSKSQLLALSGDEVVDFVLPCSLFQETNYFRSVTENTGSSFHINDFPAEILLLIFSYFSVPELCQRIIPVCKRWNCLGLDKTLWKALKFGSGWAATSNFSSSTIRELISKSPLLTTFEFHSNTHIARVIYALAKHCPRLQTLELQSKGLSYRTLDALVVNCPNIRQLSFYKVEGVDHTTYMPLANLKHLRALEFSGCEWVHDELMLAMAKNCTQLQYLNLQNLSFLTDKSLSVLLSNCKNTLKTLMLCIWDITDKSFCKVAECTQLDRLTIVPAVNINDSAFLKFQNLRNIRSLTLSRLWNVTPSVCGSVFGHANFNNLKEIDLVHADAVDNSVVRCLVTSAVNLNVLSLERCMYVTDDGLDFIVEFGKELVYLNLEGMPGISGRSLVGIDSMLPHLRVLRVDHCLGVNKLYLKNIKSQKKKSKLSVFTEYSHVYNQMESSLMQYPATHQARFQVNFGLLNVIKKPRPFELSSYVSRKEIC